jgi:hypothetical protein
MNANDFADAVRTLAAAAREAGHVAPSFRSPPGIPGAARTMRRRPDGTVQVSVALSERPWAAVQSDLVEGIVVANRLVGPAADALRRALWAALQGAGRPAGAAA